MINEKNFFDWLNSQTDDDASDLQLVRDREELIAFDRRKLLGIIDNQPYYNIVLALYHNRKTGIDFRYPMVEYPNEKRGAATLVVLKQGDERWYLLENHFRQFIKQFVLEIPRGYGIGGSGVETAIRELDEETSIKPENLTDIMQLGTLTVDSGLSTNSVELLAVEVELSRLKPQCNDENEQIDGYVILSEAQMRSMIISGKINDSFTLAAFIRYLLCK